MVVNKTVVFNLLRLNLANKRYLAIHFRRIMTSTRAAVHKDVLDLNSKDTSEVTICEMNDLSPRIKHLKLDVDNKELTFKAGQFVDFHVPGLTALTGFSMCSSPQMLEEQRKMELAVQNSDHPTPQWVHTQCQVGSKVKVRVNGDFFLELSPSEPVHVILVSGGIGINPILSMLLYTTKLAQDHAANNIKVTVMYSARSMQELVFKDLMDEVAKRHSNMVKMHYFITRESIPATSSDKEASNITLHAGRITEDSINSILNDSSDSVSNRRCYICGPSSMIETIVTYLNSAGLSDEQIYYEKWW